ncbi:MAG: hypothetical protein Q7T32_01340 [Moraxellaceae bacterium]|nr:hypothetical protein [Moraxellaceae bacterium]
MQNQQNPQTPEALLALRQQIRRDLILDTLGNTALAIGLWGWLGDAAVLHPLLETREVIIVLTATGILNLLHLPARLKRLRQLYAPRP